MMWISDMFAMLLTVAVNTKHFQHVGILARQAIPPKNFSLLLKFKDDPPSTFGPPHATTHAYPSITTFLASHSTHWIID